MLADPGAGVCPECADARRKARRAEYQRRWRAANPERVKAQSDAHAEYRKRYYADPENAAKAKAYQKAWRAKRKAAQQST